MGNLVTRCTPASLLETLRHAETPQQRVAVLREAEAYVRAHEAASAGMSEDTWVAALLRVVGPHSTENEIYELARLARAMGLATSAGHHRPSALLRTRIAELATHASTDHTRFALSSALALLWQRPMEPCEVSLCTWALIALRRAEGPSARTAVARACESVCDAYAGQPSAPAVGYVACNTLVQLYRPPDRSYVISALVSAFAAATAPARGFCSLPVTEPVCTTLVALARAVQYDWSAASVARAIGQVAAHGKYAVRWFVTPAARDALVHLVTIGTGSDAAQCTADAIWALTRRSDPARRLLAVPEMRDGLVRHMERARWGTGSAALARAIGSIARDCKEGQRCMGTSSIVDALARGVDVARVADPDASGRTLARAVRRLAGPVRGALARACDCAALADSLAQLLEAAGTEKTRAIVRSALAALDHGDESDDADARLAQVLAVADSAVRTSRHACADAPVTARFQCTVCLRTFLRACCAQPGNAGGAPIAYCCAGDGRCQAVLCRSCLAEYARRGPQLCPLCTRPLAFRPCWREVAAYLDTIVDWPAASGAAIPLREAATRCLALPPKRAAAPSGDPRAARRVHVST